MVLLSWNADTFVWQADKAAGGGRVKGLETWELAVRGWRLGGSLTWHSCFLFTVHF